MTILVLEPSLEPSSNDVPFKSQSKNDKKLEIIANLQKQQKRGIDLLEDNNYIQIKKQRLGIDVELKTIEKIDCLIEKVDKYKGTTHESYFQKKLDAAMAEDSSKIVVNDCVQSDNEVDNE